MPITHRHDCMAVWGGEGGHAREVKLSAERATRAEAHGAAEARGGQLQGGEPRPRESNQMHRLQPGCITHPSRTRGWTRAVCAAKGMWVGNVGVHVCAPGSGPGSLGTWAVEIRVRGEAKLRGPPS